MSDCGPPTKKARYASSSSSSSSRTPEEMERFRAWLSESEFKKEGGFMPHLKIIMGNPSLPNYSKASFQKQPKEGYKLKIFEKLWVGFLQGKGEEQPDQTEANEEPLEREQSPELHHKPKLVLPDFVNAFTPCTTIVRAATWNSKQLKFVFEEQQLHSVAKYLSSSFDLIFLQEIPVGRYGSFRLSNLVRAMNGGGIVSDSGDSSLIEEDSRGRKFNYILGRETVVSDSSYFSHLNAIIFPSSWKVLQHASLTSFLHPPVIAWFKPENSSSTIVASTFHISPNVGLASSSAPSKEEGIPSTTSKAISSANKTTMLARVHLHLAKMVEKAQEWGVNVPSHSDQKDLSPRWIIGGDLNTVPESLPHGLIYTTPRGMPTALVSKKTLDGFILDPLTAKTFNPMIDLVKTDPRLSDHHLLSLMLKDYE